MKPVTFTDQLVKYSGEDLSVIKRCDRRVQNRFAFIGLFVIVVFAGCFLSALYAFYNLFEKNWVIALPIALFMGWMFNNIYILLLYTLTPNLLLEKADARFTLFSLGLRLVFVAIIAMIMARPLAVLVFEPIVNREAREHRQELYNKEINQLSDKSVGREVAEKKVVELLDKSSFFIFKIRVLSYKYPFTWVVDLIIVAIFLFPIYWKYRGKTFNEYFSKRKYIERKIVAEEYDLFKKQFSHVMSGHARRPIQYFELYIDPPYNTKKKSDPDTYQKQEEFINRIYGNP